MTQLESSHFLSQEEEQNKSEFTMKCVDSEELSTIFILEFWPGLGETDALSRSCRIAPKITYQYGKKSRKLINQGRVFLIKCSMSVVVFKGF